MSVLDKLLREVAESGFPEMVSQGVSISYSNVLDSFDSYENVNGQWHIELDRKLVKASKSAKKGAIAHALARVVEEMSMSKKEEVLDRALYIISRKYRILEERNTDLSVITRGFGKELLDLDEYLEKRGYDFGSDSGISTYEMRRIFSRKEP